MMKCRLVRFTSSQDNQAAHNPEMSDEQASMAEQDTVLVVATHRPSLITSRETEDNLLAVVQRIIGVGLVRLKEPQPEGLFTRGLQVVKPEASLGMFSTLALTNAFGLLSTIFSYYLSVQGYAYAIVELFFLSGLLIMFVPNTMRLLSPAPSRLERICLLCSLGIYFYFVRFTTSPLHFSGFDEFLHWRTADDILRTGHLFNENSMLPVSPYYPGLEIVTNAVSTTTGLNTFYAASLVIALSRLLMVLALFLFYEHLTDSSRMAGIAMLIYMTNPHFLFFDTQYSYETLALPLATFMIYILARYANMGKNYRWALCLAWLVLAAVTVTHHMTDYFFDGLLILWAAVSLFRPVPRNIRVHLIAIALFSILLSLAYAFLFPRNPVWGYLSEYFSVSFKQLGEIIAGTAPPRQLFSSAGQIAPIWDELLMTVSVALITFSLPFGLLTLWHRHRHNTLAVTLSVASFIYPITQAFRFTSFGAEITDRAAAFLFLSAAYVLTVLITHFWPTRKLSRRTISLIAATLSVVFLGSFLVGTGPTLDVIPGPYEVVADARSVEPQGIDAAIWSFTYLGPSNRVATDRINEMLMSTYGDQRIVTHLNDKIDVAPIFSSAQFDSTDIEALREGRIHYLVVDLRLSTGLPLEHMYFEDDSVTSIISKSALTKFNMLPQLNRLFDSGDIAIYDTGAVINEASW